MLNAEENLKEALRTGNISRLVSIPGIGRKTAERLMVELRDKADSVSDSDEDFKTGASTIRYDAVTALVNLGYNQKVAERAVRAITDSKPNISIEELIKETLVSLNSPSP